MDVVQGVSADCDDLIRTGVPEVYRYLLRLSGGNRATAEDLVQETCIALVQALQTDPPPELTVGWMIVVARRRFLDLLRRDERDARVLESHLAIGEFEDPAWSRIEGGDALRCLGQMGDAQRAALVFRYVDDLTVAEVAELLGRSLDATESLLARGRRELARLVEEARHG